MIDLRGARSMDAGRVGTILGEFAQTTDWMPRLHTGAQDIAHAGALIDGGGVTVAMREDAVIGFIACDGAEIDALYVARRERGNGVGTALLVDACLHASKLTLWTFQANIRAISFYTRHGFVEVARTDGATTEEKLPDVQFEWQREDA